MAISRLQSAIAADYTVLLMTSRCSRSTHPIPPLAR